MAENPFRVSLAYNEPNKCWDLELLVGNIASEADAKKFADMLVEWIKNDSPSAWSARVN
jgi:hypothetical protein